MPHWAELDPTTNEVLRVIVCDADDGADGTIHPPAFCTNVLGGSWVRTYYATEGHTYAGIGYAWDGAAFIPPVVEPVDAIADAVRILSDAGVLTAVQVQDIAARTDNTKIDAIAADVASAGTLSATDIKLT